jgi:hypothetical protein
MGSAATVGYVPADSPLEWLPRLLAFAERKRRGFTIALTVLVIAVVISLVILQLGHARGPGLNLSVLVCVPVFAFGRRWPLPVLALASAAAASASSWASPWTSSGPLAWRVPAAEEDLARRCSAVAECSRYRPCPPGR